MKEKDLILGDDSNEATQAETTDWLSDTINSKLNDWLKSEGEEWIKEGLKEAIKEQVRDRVNIGTEEETEGEAEAEIEWDTTASADYVNMGLSAYSILESIDMGLMESRNKSLARKVYQMRRWSLMIAWANMKEIYDTLFDTQKDEEEDD